MDLRKVRWVAKNGSIFTEKEYKVKLEFKYVEQQIAVAYNVGKEVAEHIVEVHNTRLRIVDFAEKHVHDDL